MNLRQLVSVIEAESGGKFVRIDFDTGDTIALERERIMKGQQQVLKTYNIAQDRSADLHDVQPLAPGSEESGDLA